MNEPNKPLGWRWGLNERVTKKSGASWTGRVVGFYQTRLTEEGYCVESENEPGSVQIYPASALELYPRARNDEND